MSAKGKKNWEKVFDLKKYHDKVFFNDPEALYYPKLFYTPSGKLGLYVSFFASELNRGRDIYTEMVDRYYVSQDETRTLYKLEYNQFWATQYEKCSGTPLRYIVPVKELEVVSKPIPEEVDDDQGDDVEIAQMTIRDFAAIMWKKPVSHRNWLNILISNEKDI